MAERKALFKSVLFFLFFIFSIAPLQGRVVEIVTPQEENISIEVEEDIPLSSLLAQVEALLETPASADRVVLFTLADSASLREELDIVARRQGQYLGYPRSYHLPLSPKEQEDIRFIVTTLAHRSLPSILRLKDRLEEAGDRIDHIHPLRFLMYIFSDEELKVGIRNIRSRGMVWNQFISGICDSLATEYNIDNMPHEILDHFATTLNVSLELILPSVKERQWYNFIDVLITHIPRSGDYDRYDCCFLK